MSPVVEAANDAAPDPAGAIQPAAANPAAVAAQRSAAGRDAAGPPAAHANAVNAAAGAVIAAHAGTAQSDAAAAPASAAASAPALLLDVIHETTYRYSARVALSHHVALLQPAVTARQQVLAHELTIEPPPSLRRTHRDTFGNLRLLFTHDAPYEQLVVRAHSRVALLPAVAPEPRDDPPWEAVAAALRYRAGAPYRAEAEFTFPSPYVPLHDELAAYARVSFTPLRGLLDGALDLMHRVHADFRYAPDATEVSTPLLEAFRLRAGVCQDFAQVMLGALRALGLAARYVSGYLLTQPPPGQPRLIGADASHAWIAVWSPAAGWVELDPTNDVVPALAHVTLGSGRDYGDVAPLRGVIRGAGQHVLEVGVTVAPVGELPLGAPGSPAVGRA